MGVMLFPSEGQQELLKWSLLHPPCLPALWDHAPGCQASSLPWSQASRASRGSPQAPGSQGGLSLLPDPVAQQAPWSHSCQARQACRLSPSLLPGPSVLKVPDHPARTRSHIQHGHFMMSQPLAFLSLHPPTRPLASSSDSGHSILTRTPERSSEKTVFVPLLPA